jgi:peptide/nickel transport system permease protein
MNNAASETLQRQPSNGWRRVAHVVKTAREWPVIPMFIITVFVAFAIFAPLIAPYDPVKISLTQRLKPPVFLHGGSWAHILGTDTLGRDILTRIIFGARISLSITVLVILISAGIGLIVGVIAGYVGGRTDAILMRITDGGIAFPGLLLALLFAISLGPGMWTVVLAMSVLSWAQIARIIRGEVLQLRNMEFITQARVLGCSRTRIMLKHILPNVLNTLLVLATMYVGLVVLYEATLSFLGAGVPPPAPAWGSMVSEGRTHFTTAWWISFFPGLAIGLLVLSGNYLGDWLRDKLDPRLRQI